MKTKGRIKRFSKQISYMYTISDKTFFNQKSFLEPNYLIRPSSIVVQSTFILVESY